MTDPEIRAEIERLGLEIEYLEEVAADLGFPLEKEGWTEEFFVALEQHSLDGKREAALRVILRYSDSAGDA